MGKDNRIRLLNIMSGSQRGGAERFFERLSIAFSNNSLVKQKILIRDFSERKNLLKKYISDIDTITFYNSFNPFLQKKIKKICFEFKPNIILSWMNRASSLLPKKRLNNEVKIGRLGGYYKLKNYVNCDYLITNTEDLKEYVCEKGWDPNRVKVIPNFVNKNISKKKKKKKNKPVVVCLARFHKNKGIDVLIKSMRFLENTDLHIVGRGSELSNYKKLIKKYNLSDKVYFYDWTDNISEYLNNSDILVCPSIHEPFGNIIIEAWAHKIPVIASDIGGPSVMIENGINGLKFESKNSEQLRLRIEELIMNQNLKKKIVKKGFSLFKDNYSEDIIVEKYLSFFRKILS